MAQFISHPASPVVGPGYTVTACFDCSVLLEGDRLRMWFSWRDMHSIGYCESDDGVQWTPPRLVFEFDRRIEWEKGDVNRPAVVKAGSTYYMWYTGQNWDTGQGAIGLATSADGLSWQRATARPVLGPAGGWEKGSLMCPHVLHEGGRFRMWYSAGEMYEPDAIGYAESADGLNWAREGTNPILQPAGGWEADRVAAICVVPRATDYLAFYVGFANGFENSQIGMARSPDGIHDWQRYGGNPIIKPGPAGSWDDCNVYKPFALRFRDRWFIWYNASRASDRREQIGLATAVDVDF